MKLTHSKTEAKMKTNRRLISTLIIVMCFSTLFAQAPKWKLLGTRKVTFKTEKDVINVGANKGVFKKIKLTIKKSGINFKDMKVHFANGDIFDVQIRRVIPAGGETRVIDLPGKNRNIKKVVFWYKSTKKNKKRATVRLYGKK
jgi:hypothetical protein